ncbi:MAG TPA: hypothetical protein VIL46_13160, partial [Gemmataceae bacterium]
VYSFAQCLEQGLLSFHDEGAVLLAASPWRSPEPLRLLADRPREAFAVDTDLPRLRVPWREGSAGEAVLGVLTFRGGDLYPGLPLARPEVAELPPNRKVWDPRLSRTTGKFPPGVYSSLTDALSAVQPGDVLLVRYTGLLPIDPQELAKVNQRDLTIRPDEGYRPVLTLSQSERASAALFKVFNGRLVLEGLQFDLRSLQPEKELSRGVVTVVGGGECVLRDCVVTLEEASDVAFAAVRIDDPEGEMKPGVADTLPAPQVRLENSWVRGRGDLLAVSPSRPFEFAFDNGLAALDGSLVRVEAGDKNGPAAGVSAVRLRRVTTYLTEHLLHLQARPDEGASPGLVPVEVTAADCAFAPAGPYALAFVQVDHVAGEAALRERGLLAWKDARNNVYGYSDQHAMLRIDPGDGGEMMPPKPFGVDKWLAFTLEEGRPFTRVRFAAQFVPGQPLTAVRPDDFRIRALDPPPLPEPDPETLGANADRLPVLFSDRDEEPPPPQG